MESDLERERVHAKKMGKRIKIERRSVVHGRLQPQHQHNPASSRDTLRLVWLTAYSILSLYCRSFITEVMPFSCNPNFKILDHLMYLQIWIHIGLLLDFPSISKMPITCLLKLLCEEDAHFYSLIHFFIHATDCYSIKRWKALWRSSTSSRFDSLACPYIFCYVLV